MKYYTKEWYELMQQQQYTSGMQKIPDKTYSDQEIQAFYDADLAAEVAHDREIYDTAPNYDWYETLLDPSRFHPHMFSLSTKKQVDNFILILRMKQDSTLNRSAGSEKKHLRNARPSTLPKQLNVLRLATKE